MQPFEQFIRGLLTNAQAAASPPAFQNQPPATPQPQTMAQPAPQPVQASPAPVASSIIQNMLSPADFAQRSGMLQQASTAPKLPVMGPPAQDAAPSGDYKLPDGTVIPSDQMDGDWVTVSYNNGQPFVVPSSYVDKLPAGVTPVDNGAFSGRDRVEKAIEVGRTVYQQPPEVQGIFQTEETRLTNQTTKVNNETSTLVVDMGENPVTPVPNKVKVGSGEVTVDTTKIPEFDQLQQDLRINLNPNAKTPVAANAKVIADQSTPDLTTAQLRANEAEAPGSAAKANLLENNQIWNVGVNQMVIQDETGKVRLVPLRTDNVPDTWNIITYGGRTEDPALQRAGEASTGIHIPLIGGMSIPGTGKKVLQDIPFTDKLPQGVVDVANLPGGALNKAMEVAAMPQQLSVGAYADLMLNDSVPDVVKQIANHSNLMDPANMSGMGLQSFGEWIMNHQDDAKNVQENGYTSKDGQRFTGGRAVWELYQSQNNVVHRAVNDISTDPFTVIGGAGGDIGKGISRAGRSIGATDKAADASRAVDAVRVIDATGDTARAATTAGNVARSMNPAERVVRAAGRGVGTVLDETGKFVDELGQEVNAGAGALGRGIGKVRDIPVIGRVFQPENKGAANRAGEDLNRTLSDIQGQTARDIVDAPALATDTPVRNTIAEPAADVPGIELQDGAYAERSGDGWNVYDRTGTTVAENVTWDEAVNTKINPVADAPRSTVDTAPAEVTPRAEPIRPVDTTAPIWRDTGEIAADGSKVLENVGGDLRTDRIDSPIYTVADSSLRDDAISRLNEWADAAPNPDPNNIFDPNTTLGASGAPVQEPLDIRTPTDTIQQSAARNTATTPTSAVDTQAGRDLLEKNSDLSYMSPVTRDARDAAGKGFRATDRALELANTYPDKARAFFDEYKAKAQTALKRNEQTSAPFYEDDRLKGLETKRVVETVNEAEHYISDVLPSFDSHFGDVEPAPDYVWKTKPGESSVPDDRNFAKQNNDQLMERYIFDEREKVANDARRLLEKKIYKVDKEGNRIIDQSGKPLTVSLNAKRIADQLPKAESLRQQYIDSRIASDTNAITSANTPPPTPVASLTDTGVTRAPVTPTVVAPTDQGLSFDPSQGAPRLPSRIRSATTAGAIPPEALPTTQPTSSLVDTTTNIRRTSPDAREVTPKSNGVQQKIAAYPDKEILSSAPTGPRRNVSLPGEGDYYLEAGGAQRPIARSYAEVLAQEFTGGETLGKRYQRYVDEAMAPLDEKTPGIDRQAAEEQAQMRLVNDWKYENLNPELQRKFDQKLDTYTTQKAYPLKGFQAADKAMRETLSREINNKAARVAAKGWTSMQNFVRGNLLYNVVSGPRTIFQQFLGNFITPAITGNADASLGGFHPKAIAEAYNKEMMGGASTVPITEFDRATAEYGLKGDRSNISGSIATRDQMGSTIIDEQKRREQVGRRKFGWKILNPINNPLMRVFAGVSDLLQRENLYTTILDSFASEAKINLRDRMMLRKPASMSVEDFNTRFDALPNRFSANDVRESFGDVNEKWADRGARDWQEALVQGDKAATAEVERIYFMGEMTNLDMALKNVTIFHYWMSRAMPLYTASILKDPVFLYNYSKMTDAMERAQTDDAWSKGFVGFMKSPLGYLMAARPDTFFPIFTQIWNDAGYTPEGQSWLGKFLTQAGVMTNPIISTAVNMTGAMGDTYAPDPTGTIRVRRTIAQSVDLYNVLSGQPGRPTAPIGDNMWLIGREKISSLLEGEGVPLAKTVPYHDTMNYAYREINNLVVDIAKEKGMDPNDPVVTAAMEDPESALYQEAYGRYTKQKALDLGLSVTPIGVLYPKSTLISPKTRNAQAAREREARTSRGETSPTPFETESYSINDITNTIDPVSKTLKTQQNEYQNLGTAKQQSALGIYYSIAFGNTADIVNAGGYEWTPMDIAALPEEEKTALADMWAEEAGVTEDVTAAKDLRKTYKESHAEYKGYADWRNTASDDPNGPDAYWQTIITANPNAARYYNSLPTDQRNDMNLTSVDAYLAATGHASSYRDPAPLAVRDQSKIPYLGPEAAAGTGFGKGTGPTGPTKESITKSIGKYQQDVALYNDLIFQTWGQHGNIDTLDPMSRAAMTSIIQDKYGVSPPQYTGDAADYLKWAANQSGDSSVDAYIQWYNNWQESAGVAPQGVPSTNLVSNNVIATAPTAP